MPKASRKRSVTHVPSAKVVKPVEDIIMENLLEISAEIPVEQPPISNEQDTEANPTVTKKQKAQQKREQFLKKLGVTSVQFSKSHTRRLKRKARDQIAGGMSDMKEIIELMEEPVAESSEAASGNIRPKVGQIGAGASHTLSENQRQKALKLERTRIPLILSNPDFTTNPFATIRKHAQNTLLQTEKTSA